MRFKIDNMTCGGCARSVTRAIQKLDPAAQVEADQASHEAKVQSSADPGALLAALAEAGYPATQAG